LDRPATAITVLRERAPRIVGGRDELAGGTWLAVNDQGVVAGLTNRPSALGRDPSKRSRGELPLLLAASESAERAVTAFMATVRPSEYNAAWMLVGDRRSLYYIELDGTDHLEPRPLDPGIHILENLSIDAPSAKVDRARELVGDLSQLSVDGLRDRLAATLADHQVPVGGASERGQAAARNSRGRPICVHGDSFGTRSSMIVLVPENERPGSIYVADGRPCEVPFVDESGRWLADSKS
jgi:uncharacterized protein with NRDE domain